MVTQELEIVQKFSTRWRTILAFWIFGLCNNFPHILMLSAAADIIEKGKYSNGTENAKCLFDRGTRHCDGTKSVGMILLFDNVPGFITKLIVIFLAQGLSYKLEEV
ncbi:unnamed protein product, partial [Mesorhabditis belari]|uniref:Battenin n=1 Tax=Mesorhabditis belari TaxID=2138241 RepID=A0AAF3EN66_9BILA